MNQLSNSALRGRGRKINNKIHNKKVIRKSKPLKFALRSLFRFLFRLVQTIVKCLVLQQGPVSPGPFSYPVVFAAEPRSCLSAAHQHFSIM
jgi:hypothetical protein